MATTPVAKYSHMGIVDNVQHYRKRDNDEINNTCLKTQINKPFVTFQIVFVSKYKSQSAVGKKKHFGPSPEEGKIAKHNNIQNTRHVVCIHRKYSQIRIPIYLV